MTRINVVPVEELSVKHLIAEYREIVRPFALVRKAVYDNTMKSKVIPKNYTLGTGHVLFFYDKLKFVHDRYQDLVAEIRRRGYTCNPIGSAELLKGIPTNFYRDYVPTEEALKINRERIELRSKPKG